MRDVFDYIEWRGDISMAGDPINDVDMLILCRLSYMPFDAIVPASLRDAPVALGEAAQAVLRSVEQGERAFRLKEDQQLLEALIDSPRFSRIPLYAFRDVYSEEREEQFSAITMALEDGTLAVLYRGTDGTLVGWKEDVNMSFSPEIPAQKDALRYLAQTAAAFPEKKLRLAGHSKGGNLAIYAAAFCDFALQDRILAVRNLDGPGFNEYQAAAGHFQRIADVTLTYLPESSVVGMLLEHMEKSVIVGSQSMGLFQHNIYLWEIRRADFIRKEDLHSSSHVIDRTLKDWLGSLTVEERERMFDGIFQILQSSNGKTLRELWNGKNVLTILSTAVKLDPETKEHIATGLRLFKNAMQNHLNAQRMLESLTPRS